MTQNQLRLREIREKERSNRVYESIETGKLAETIANNLRSYRINVSKNQIQRLADDRLDDRERSRISETIRSDLAKELETNRHNLKDEEIRRIKNTIDSLKNKYEPGPLIAALLGLMPDGDIEKLYGTTDASAWFSKVFETIPNAISKPSKIWKGKDIEEISEEPLVNPIKKGFKSTNVMKAIPDRKVREMRNEIPDTVYSGKGRSMNPASKNYENTALYTMSNRKALVDIASGKTDSNVIYSPGTRKGPGYQVPDANGVGIR